MPANFRPAVASDVSAIVDIECRAFGRDTAESREYKRRELDHELADYVVLEDDGQVVAAARILRHWLQVGRCAVLKGDVGHVAVLPELHGKGHGTTLMQRVIPYLRDKGFHLSRLGGLMKFYSRFGYEPFLRRYVHLPVHPLDNDIKGTPWREIYGLTPQERVCVRRYDPSRDARAVHELRQRFNRGRCGHLLLAEPPPPPTAAGPNPDAYDFVYEDDGEVRAFLRGALGLVNAGDPAPSYRIDELAADYDHPQAVAPLLKHFILQAAQIAPTTISCRLPYDEWLFGLARQAQLYLEVSEWRQSVDGNMMQVVNLPETLRVGIPEWYARLHEAGVIPWMGTVHFRLPNDEAVLEVIPEAVRVGDGTQGDVTVTASQADFIMWLLGIAGFGEFPHLSAHLTGPQRLTLSIIFPRLPCASGVWG